ncbi:unnamed protein product [Mesocestoides corti]|uniref:cGMP-dependent protein kinase N-terminal coiled-coil domain-containing protein n=1 Tax=Mesocestoides corti TaxID=53468 RepID=A0A0R3UHL9_MESCO|nr:unnamed protein product [Mesocestoides corti]
MMNSIDDNNMAQVNLPSSSRTRGRDSSGVNGTLSEKSFFLEANPNPETQISDTELQRSTDSIWTWPACCQRSGLVNTNKARKQCYSTPPPAPAPDQSSTLWGLELTPQSLGPGALSRDLTTPLRNGTPEADSDSSALSQHNNHGFSCGQNPKFSLRDLSEAVSQAEKRAHQSIRGLKEQARTTLRAMELEERRLRTRLESLQNELPNTRSEHRSPSPSGVPTDPRSGFYDCLVSSNPMRLSVLKVGRSCGFPSTMQAKFVPG